MIQNIVMLRKLHGIRNVYILDHCLCDIVSGHIKRTKLATSDSKNVFDDYDISNIEASMHKKYLTDAYKIIKQELPELTVYLYLYQEDGVILNIDPDIDNQSILVDRF